MTSRVIAADYSMTCPALCVFTDDTLVWHVNHRTRKTLPPLPSVTWGTSSAEGEVPRYIELAQWTYRVVADVEPDVFVLEDYAFGGKGRITQLSENVGVLKAMLFAQFPTLRVMTIAPTTIKKYATGNGRAQKEDMWHAFVAQHPDADPWPGLVSPKATSLGSPLADIADAYFLARYGREL